MRIDMTSRDWHELVRPVLPHAFVTKDWPELSHVRIELGDKALYAVASDKYTLGAERHPLARDEQHQAMPPVHVLASELTASLKLFGYSKDDDPPLTITIDSRPAAGEFLGQDGMLTSLAVTLDSADGGRVIMRDHRMASRDQLAGWRKYLREAMTRQPAHVLDGLDLSGGHFAKWKDAVRAGERLRLYSGPERGDALLITVGAHFAGIWAVGKYGDGPTEPVSALPWLAEVGIPDEETGELITLSDVAAEPEASDG
jgi:hypothetical protein